MKLKEAIAVLLFSLCFVLVSCKAKPALEYSNSMVKVYSSLLPEANATESKISKYIEEGNFDTIIVIAEKMEHLIDAKLTELDSVPVPHVNNALEYKESMKAFFNYIKSIYNSYKGYGMAPPGRDREKAAQMTMAILKNKDTVVYRMQQIQQKFAESNGFKIKQ